MNNAHIQHSITLATIHSDSMRTLSAAIRLISCTWCCSTILLITPIDFYREAKMKIFQNFGKLKFHSDIRIQLKKLNILRGLLNRFGQSTPNHHFSLFEVCCAGNGKSSLHAALQYLPYTHADLPRKTRNPRPKSYLKVTLS